MVSMDQLSDDTWIHFFIFLDDVEFMRIQTVCQHFYKLTHSPLANSHWKSSALSVMKNWNSKQDKQINDKNLNNPQLQLNRTFPLEKMSDYVSIHWHRIYYELIEFTYQSNKYQRLLRSYPLVFDMCQMNLLMLLKLLLNTKHKNDSTKDNNNNNNSNNSTNDKQAAFNINMMRCGYIRDDTLLSCAIGHQNVEIIEYLLSFNNIDLNIESYYRIEDEEFSHTPLMYAVWRTPKDKEKRLKIIQMLLNHPKMTKECINKRECGNYLRTALDYACDEGDSQVVKILVKHGANTAGNGCSYLV